MGETLHFQRWSLLQLGVIGQVTLHVLLLMHKASQHCARYLKSGPVAHRNMNLRTIVAIKRAKIKPACCWHQGHSFALKDVTLS